MARWNSSAPAGAASTGATSHRSGSSARNTADSARGQVGTRDEGLRQPGEVVGPHVAEVGHRLVPQLDALGQPGLCQLLAGQ